MITLKINNLLGDAAVKSVLFAAACVVSALALSGCAGAPDSGAKPGFDLAITVDDLPAHGSLPPGETRTQVAQQYLAALKAHNVPEAYGFINAVAMDREPESAQTLDLWRQAGYPLGNHTWSHQNINSVGLETFESEIAKDEPVLQDKMGDADWHWLRFPFLAAGTDPALHAGVMDYLKAHNYRIADVSTGYDDWAYTDTYARCMAKGATAAVEAMKTQYMSGVKASIKHSLAASQKGFGRQIPLVVLMHEGAFSALMLPQVLDEYQAEGARFITLKQAESDPAYAETDAHAGDGSLIERTAMEQGIDLSGPDVPKTVDISNLATMCQ